MSRTPRLRRSAVTLAQNRPDSPAVADSGGVLASQMQDVADGHAVRYLELRVSRGCDLRRPVVDSVADGTLAG